MGDNKFTGDMFKVKDGEPIVQLNSADAVRLVKNYHWVYANSSTKDLEEAKEESLKLSNAVGSPLILVYLSRHVFFDTHSRNTYPGAFRDSIHLLIKEGARSDQLLIAAKSYSVHQVLHAINNFDDASPAYSYINRILFIGISPAFGAFGNVFSSNVARYHSDIQRTSCKFYMIASNDDGITWRAGGAARRWKSRRSGFKGDNKVGKAIEENYGKRVKVITINGANHPMDDYLECGLVDAMRRCGNESGFQTIRNILNPDLCLANKKGDLWW